MADLALTKVSETSSKITFSYPKAAGAEGYRYTVNGNAVSRTFNPDDLEVTFGKVANATYRVIPLDVSDRADGYVWPAPVTPEPGGNAYWYETWDSGTVPAGWSTEVNAFGLGNPGLITYDFPTDPLGQYGKVVRFQCRYDPAKSTNYNSPDKQLVSFYRGANNAHSGYGQLHEETWYSGRLMWPSGAAWSDGETNFLYEWHTDNSTQSMGGNSPGMMWFGGYPLTSDGTTNGGLVLRWAGGTPSSPTYEYWPSSGNGAQSQVQPVPFPTDTWFDVVFRVVWSRDPSKGRVEWYVNGQQKYAATRATLYANSSLPNGQSYNTFGIYDYRYNVTRTSTVYWDRVAAGPSRASVQ